MGGVERMELVKVEGVRRVGRGRVRRGGWEGWECGVV